MAALCEMTKDEMCDFMVADFSNAEIKKVIRHLQDVIEGLFVSGSKDDLVDQLRARPPTKDELIDAIDESTDWDVTEDYEFEEDEYLDFSDDNDEDTFNDYDLPARKATRRTFEVRPLKFSEVEAKKGARPYQLKAVDELRTRFKKQNAKNRGYLYVATGGGKTRIANDFILNEYLAKGRKVLWITHHSLLLYQAAHDLVARYGDKIGDVENKLGYFASEGKSWLLKDCLDSYKEREFLKPPQVLYTTWQSLDRGLCDRNSAKKIRSFAPELVVVDEAHWGKGGSLEDRIYSELFDGEWKKQNILGLSATPKVRFATKWSKDHVGNISFPYLVGMGYLARPIPVPLELHSGIQIQIDEKKGIITNYKQIGRDKRRNQEIVRHYQSNRTKYGKTLFFACDKEHADILGEMLKGENALVIHTGKHDPQAALEKFKDKGFNVGIAVGMAKEGVDIPDLKTVILCRPVTSQIEFAQMIGRASRRTEEKSVFYIVDCYDSLGDSRMENLLYHFQDYFVGANDKESTSPIRKRTPTRKKFQRVDRESHDYDPLVGMKLIRIGNGSNVAEDPALQLLNGLRINPRQTFGIELELAAQDQNVDHENKAQWQKRADVLYEALVKALGEPLVKRPGHQAEANYSKWSIVHDGSCGWEIVSPILLGQSGFEQLLAVLTTIESEDVLTKSKLEVNWKTGFHAHLGWKYGDAKKVKRILQFIRMIEPSLFSLVSPSRVITSDGEPNEYCESVRRRFSDSKLSQITNRGALDKYFGDEDDRYSLINLTKYDKPTSTIEVRLHNGTFDPAKVSLWVSLWMNILSSIDNFDLPAINQYSCKPEVVLPNAAENSDIVSVCFEYLGMQLKEHLPMLERLHRRRREVIGGQYWRTLLKKRRVDVDALLSAWDSRFAEITEKLG